MEFRSICLQQFSSKKTAGPSTQKESESFKEETQEESKEEAAGRPKMGQTNTSRFVFSTQSTEPSSPSSAASILICVIHSLMKV